MKENRKKEGEGRRSSKVNCFPWIRVSFFIFACAFLIIASGPLPEKVWRKWKGTSNKRVVKNPTQAPSNKKKGDSSTSTGSVKAKGEEGQSPVKPTENKTPPKVEVIPKAHFATSGGDVRKMSKGFTLKTKLIVDKKGDLASKERVRNDSYVASYELKIKLPKPSKDLESLEKVSPKLGKLLPGLSDMMPKAQVSRFFYEIYNNKVKRIKARFRDLGALMTLHNFYDCETILNLKHPKTGRRVILLQSEMDVVSDGSDGDRLPTMPSKIVNSSYYQPMTSYGWKKVGGTPNPLIKGWKGRIAKANAEIAKPGTTSARKAWLRARIKKIKREIQDMKYRSYLIAEYDPFIVMPINMIRNKSDKYAAHVGDYAVVIYKGKIYPTIVGDAGPSFKTGEASLRIAKQLNARAGIYSRPVSDLTVTYLVFPGTAEKPKQPDYETWKKRCETLLSEIGGLGEGKSLFTWKDTFPKKEPKVEIDHQSNEGNPTKTTPSNKDSKSQPLNSRDKENTPKVQKTTPPDVLLPPGVTREVMGAGKL